MGCNCGKSRPTGYGTNAPKPKPAETSGQKQAFTLRTVSGTTQTFGSKLEADAAKVRAGGGTVRPA